MYDFSYDIMYNIHSYNKYFLLSISITFNIVAVYCVVAAIFFKQSHYNVRESERAVELELTLSTPSSFDITVYLNEIDNTANKGKQFTACSVPQ